MLESVVMIINIMLAARKNVRDTIGPDCTSVIQSECKQDKVHIALTALVIFWILMYCVWFHKYIFQELHRLSGYAFPF